jgi:hypothetical protein
MVDGAFTPVTWRMVPNAGSLPGVVVSTPVLLMLTNVLARTPCDPAALSVSSPRTGLTKGKSAAVSR